MAILREKSAPDELFHGVGELLIKIEAEKCGGMLCHKKINKKRRQKRRSGEGHRLAQSVPTARGAPTAFRRAGARSRRMREQMLPPPKTARPHKSPRRGDSRRKIRLGLCGFYIRRLLPPLKRSPSLPEGGKQRPTSATLTPPISKGENYV